MPLTNPPATGGGVADGDKGDITVSGDVWTVAPTTGTGNFVKATSPALVTPTGLVKGDVGLANVDNTTDANKPISTATQTALNGKAATAHTHNASDVNTGTLATVRLGSGTANATTFLRGDQTWATPAGGGGSDPWTILTLGSDVTTTSATAVDVAGLAFTPAANTKYMFEGLLLCRTATTTVGPRPGLAWPTGGTDGVVMIDVTSAAGTRVMANGNLGAAVLAPAGGLPTTTQSWPASIWGQFQAGASPSGTIKVQVASETAGTTVTIKAGSYLRYRTYT